MQHSPCDFERIYKMKLTFLGTSHGVPSATRHCTSMMLEVGERTYLIDAGAPIADCLEQQYKDPASIQAVFITHMHGDHINGLFHMIDLMMWYYKNCKPQIYMPEDEGIQMFEGYMRYMHSKTMEQCGITYHKIAAGNIYDDGILKVTAIPTLHISGGIRPSFAFLVQAEGKKILFNGDRTANLIDFPKEAYADSLDAMVAELAHCPAEKLAEKVMPCKVKKLFVIHVAPLSKYDQIKKYAENFPFSTAFPNDGDVYEI